MTSENVKVIARCRPMNTRERALNSKNVVFIDSEKCTCSIVNPTDGSAPPKTFTFDGVYGPDSNTEQIYNDIAYPFVEGILEGYNCTVFAYGQTGCGKSFSMQGVDSPPNQRGIIPRAFEHVFEAISVTDDVKFLVLASYIEIYNEEVRDLLSTDTKRRLELKENPERGVYVHELSHHAVHDVIECQKLMEQGWRNRATGATMMNADSSRSHSIFTISVEMMSTSQNEDDIKSIKRGKLSLVDLAGSERQAKTGASGDRLREATKINLSLSALGNVISALVDGKAKHIPYRDSKLTRLLQDSLGGNTKTLMVACLSPADNNYDETLSTLRYANRAKNIYNEPHVNEDPKDTMLRQYQEQIKKLKELLEASTSQLPTSNGQNDISEKEKLRLEYQDEMVKLREKYQEEYNSKCQMQADLKTLKEKYDKNLAKISNQNDNSCRTSSPQQIVEKALKSNRVELNSSQQEILKRLKKLQESMVGGERVNDKELQERRLRKKKAAERRLNALARALATVETEDGPNLVLGVYDDIQEELRAKNEALKKYRQKLKASDREVADIQSEFENERTDYLETIRKQERQIKLQSQILEKIVPTLSKECNYSNLERLKEDAEWEDDTQSWILPELTRIKLPPASAIISGFEWVGASSSGRRQSVNSLTAPARLENSENLLAMYTFHPLQHKYYIKYNIIGTLTQPVNGSAAFSTFENGRRKMSLGIFNTLAGLSFDKSSSSDSSRRSSSPDVPVIYDQKYQKSAEDDFAGNYFKPKRATELLIQSHGESGRPFHKWKGHRRISPENIVKKPTKLESLLPVIGDRKLQKNTLDRI
ncbi:osmotic avoidance abnormal protein 3 isoform X2 [Aphis craccivora]|uniref:Kinesin-like protein n=1 Tax=Aphis craccivora TaxID=307492 RepID=A0A6G0YI39_APHCR|nr:osmotic avoidance abnormal protein 3 isoform X2 [Aphis craccivora]